MSCVCSCTHYCGNDSAVPSGLDAPNSIVPRLKAWAILKSPFGRRRTNSLFRLGDGGLINDQTSASGLGGRRGSPQSTNGSSGRMCAEKGIRSTFPRGSGRRMSSPANHEAVWSLVNIQSNASTSHENSPCHYARAGPRGSSLQRRASACSPWAGRRDPRSGPNGRFQ